MTDTYVNNIIHSLEKVGSGAYRRFEIFNDWLELVEASLAAMPGHLESVSQHKTFAQDSPEAKQLWERMRKRYQNSPASWSHLADAFGYLLESTQNDFDDVLGRVYMTWEIGNARAGQYFTPLPVAKAMADSYDIRLSTASLREHCNLGELHQCWNLLDSLMEIIKNLMESP